MNLEPHGFSIPFRIDPDTRGVATSTGPEKIRENIRHILLTGIGERMMRRDYGAGVRELVHDPNNDALRGIMQHQIAKAIARLEPRVQLQSVTITQHRGTLHAEVRYILREAQQPQGISVSLGIGVI